MKNFSGSVLFLDRSDINTDEIIPAKHLTEPNRENLGPYLLEDLELDGFDRTRDLEGRSVILTRANFGCGSSREHAPWALEINGFNLVIAESFARIFRQNMFNCGMLAVELSKKTIDYLFLQYSDSGAYVTVDFEKSVIVISNDTAKDELSFHLSGFDKELVKANGWVEYADSRY